jgi:hypothetical protein
MLSRHLRAALLALPLLAAPVSGQSFNKFFDDVGAPGAFSQIPPGFDNGPLLEYDEITLEGGVILIDALFGSSATSGDNILATCDTCLLGDSPPTGLPGLITGTLNKVVDSISLDVINGSTATGANFTLTAFGLDDEEVASETVFLTTMGSASFVKQLSVTAPAIRSFTLTTAHDPGYTFAMDSLQAHVVEGDWTDLGQGLAGTHGAPTLVGNGTLYGGDLMALTLSSALESSIAAVVVGLGEINIPFMGGVMVPSIDLLIWVPTSPTGFFETAVPWPEGAPSGSTLTFQFWVVDAAGPFGLSASNAVRATAP